MDKYIEEELIEEEENKLKKERIKFIEKELENLTDIQKNLVQLYFYENKTKSQIARETGIDVRNVDRYLKKIIKKIQKKKP